MQKVFNVPDDPDRLDEVITKSYDAATVKYVTFDNEKQKGFSVWGTESASEKKPEEGRNANRFQHILQKILAIIQTCRTIKTPLAMPNGGASYPGKDLPPIRVIIKKLSYAPGDA
ncbi:hypothetical protein DL764_010285 [Monosporascus ibericus]|uniref:Uncharacterized protein n=1 Tax=Monosporascus ibericus TaxID=155417 RepID=A0A4Q4SV67_9PEZI|nr:hypothetical protein DL764_010285 [Monosporascus ibericus]